MMNKTLFVDDDPLEMRVEKFFCPHFSRALGRDYQFGIMTMPYEEQYASSEGGLAFSVFLIASFGL